jgi:nucleotide-binding universal stress UspA family protein
MTGARSMRPVLFCFDGSEDAANAIASAGALLGPRPAVVITVCETMKVWAPSDPATILDAPIGKALSQSLELDEIADEVAHDEMDQGVRLARAAGFQAKGRVVGGKPWRAICDVADELDAAVIVLGARGLSRVQSVLLGSVSATVSAHARRPVLIVHQSGSTTATTDAEGRGSASAEPDQAPITPDPAAGA